MWSCACKNDEASVFTAQFVSSFDIAAADADSERGEDAADGRVARDPLPLAEHVHVALRLPGTIVMDRGDYGAIEG